MKLRLKRLVRDRPNTEASKPGTQAPSLASFRLDADERGEHSSSGIRGAVTPEEPALRARAPTLQSKKPGTQAPRLQASVWTLMNAAHTQVQRYQAPSRR